MFSLLEAGGKHPWKDKDRLQLQAKEEKNRRGVPLWAVTQGHDALVEGVTDL